MATHRKPEPQFDRTPPQNADAERSVLGAMMLNMDAVGTAIELLHENAEEVFYVPAHQHIYAAMIGLTRRNMPVDAVTLASELDRMGQLESCGGLSYLSELQNVVPTSANVEHYAKIVLDAALLRRLITACAQVSGEAYAASGDVSELLDHAEQQIFNIAEKRQLNPITRVGELLGPAIEHIERVIRSKTGYTGLPTGFKRLDEMLSGLQTSDMIVLAARPSVGKTACALNIAANVGVRQKKAVLIFSLEMSKEQLVTRLICMEGHINSKRLRSGFLAGSEFPKLQKAAAKLSDTPIYIDDTPNIGLLELRSKARRHHARHKVDLVIIDYLQLMSGSARSSRDGRQLEVAEISRSIKGLAREMRVPVLVLSQLNREAEKDEEGAPKLSHLRESGAIEQDADVVLMLSRPSASQRQEIQEKFDVMDADSIILLTVAKQRNGPTGGMFMLFEKDLQRFGEIATPREGGPPSAVDERDRASDDLARRPGRLAPPALLDDDEDDVPF